MSSNVGQKDRLPGQPTRLRRAFDKTKALFVPYLGAVHDVDLGSKTLTTTGFISAGKDTNLASYFGRTCIGYGGSGSDYMWISHLDHIDAGDYALVQSAAGSTFLNAILGQKVYLCINNTAELVVDVGSFNFQAGNLATTGAYNNLTLTKQTVGFTIAGGTTSKTLTVADNTAVDQDVKVVSSPTFTDLTISTPSNIYALSHDSFADFDANKHIDHTGVTLTAGTGISGGGDISAGRTFNLDILNLVTDTLASGDWIPFHDLSDAPNKIAFSDFEATLDHNSLTNTHNLTTDIDHGSLTGLSDDDHTGYHTDARAVTWLAANHETIYTHADIALNTTHRSSDGDDHGFINQDVQILAIPTFDDLIISNPSAIYNLSHDSFADFDSDKHVSHAGVVLTAGLGISGGGSIALSRSFILDLFELAEDTIAAGDWVPFHDVGDAPNKITFANFEGTLSHDNLADYSASEHIDWTNASAHFTTSLNVSCNKMVMTGSSGHFDSQSAVNVLDFDVKTGTTINATTYCRFGRGTDSGTGSLFSWFYKGDASATFAAYINHKTGDFRAAREIRADSHFDVNGVNGLSGTYSFGGGGTGDIATMTFTGGILTAVTTVP